MLPLPASWVQLFLLTRKFPSMWNVKSFGPFDCVCVVDQVWVSEQCCAEHEFIFPPTIFFFHLHHLFRYCLCADYSHISVSDPHLPVQDPDLCIPLLPGLLYSGSSRHAEPFPQLLCPLLLPVLLACTVLFQRVCEFSLIPLLLKHLFLPPFDPSSSSFLLLDVISVVVLMW